jgi:hypothetical protein
MPSEPTPKDEALCAAAPEMLEKLKKVVNWLDCLACHAEAEEKQYRGEWESLADNARRDAKNWRATAADILATIAAVDPKWVKQWGGKHGRG